MHFACIVGARPNFMKIAPILRALENIPAAKYTLIHTGQHYDSNLSDIFFEELEIPPPDLSLGVGSGTHAEQTAKLLVALENAFVDASKNGSAFSRVVVVGDVNSTMAATLAAVKLHIPVAHVEAGLRSRDRRMPEEINRIVTDSLCDMLLVSEPEGVENLQTEGHPDQQIHLVGNVMIDTLLRQVQKARKYDTLDKLNVRSGEYCVVTLHRPSNVDRPEILSSLIDVLIDVSERLPIVFPIHPRTSNRIDEFGLRKKLDDAKNIQLLEPLGYMDFLCLTSQSKAIVTDSGGLQEESTALLVPCLTMRENTERPITVTQGTSTLIGNDSILLKKHLNEILDNQYKCGSCPELWDGKASERIAQILCS